MSRSPNSTARNFAARVSPALALAAVLAAAFSNCAVGPDFERPAAPDVHRYLPPEAQADAGTIDAVDAAEGIDGGALQVQKIALGEAIPAQWWSLFHSPRLDETLQQAIAANYTLVAAKATLLETHEAVVQARASLLPKIDLTGSAHTAISSGSLSRSTTGASNLFSIGPSASYSVDVFGGTRRGIEEAEANEENQRYQLAAAWLTLTGSSVTEAIALASARFQIATVQELIKNDEKNLQLIQREFNAGKLAKADVLTAAAQLASDRTQLPALRAQASVARHALAVLTSRAAGEWSPPEFDIDEFALPGDLPLSLPSELVHQRPDILAAEATLHADSAAIGVATAAMYPSLTLTSSLVQQAQSIAGLFQSAATLLSAGGSFDAPLYRGGALSSQKRAAVDAYQSQLATYQQTVMVAFGQVADALAALEFDAEMVASSTNAVEIARQSLEVQRSTYVAGKTTALQLIAAENTYSSARLGYVRAIGQRFSDTAQLFIAAGGGWSNEAPRQTDHD